MQIRITAGCILFLTSAFAAGQESPVGKYTGSYKSTSSTIISIVLEIKSADNGVIEGKAARYSTARSPVCAGEYPVTGSLKGNQLSVRSTEKGGSAQDCTFRLTGTFEGNKLQAKLGQNEFEMTK